jgi:hypothetical protein
MVGLGYCYLPSWAKFGFWNLGAKWRTNSSIGFPLAWRRGNLLDGANQ